MYNSGDPYGVRLDPLLNDSIKVDVGVSYDPPHSGTVTFIQNEGWFYRPDPDFYGVDIFDYAVCYGQDCLTATITMHVEEPLDLSTCLPQINGESVQTRKDQPIAIRIFINDTACPYQGSSLQSPEKGNFDVYAYSGSFKNIIYVYYPPKGYVGTDRFTYKLFTADGDLTAQCEVTITD